MSELIMQQWQQITESSWLILFSILGFGVGVFVYRRCGKHPLSHPLLISTPLIGLGLYLLKIDYVDYYAANGVLNWLLGAATVALAVPFSLQIKNLSSLWPVILLTVPALAREVRVLPAADYPAPCRHPRAQRG